MRNTIGLARLFTLLFSNLLIFSLSAATDGPRTLPASSQGSQQWEGQGSCGPDCSCGCLQGGVCTCHNPSVARENTYGVSECNQIDAEACGSGSFCNDPEVCCRYHDLSLQTAECCDKDGIWLPEDPVLFRPFMADPREICYSVGWRFNDNALTKNIIDVSFGDTLAIYRWCDMWPWHGQLQIEIEGAVWAVFDPCTESAPLINADYYVGFPLTYAIDRWQFRLRPFHISSHIGDEFLLNHPGFDRRNASNEYIDFFISHDFTEEIRFYGGIGYILREDESFKIKRYYSAVGAELRLMHLSFRDDKDCLMGFPIFAMHFRQNAEFKKHVDATYILGYQISKLCGLCRNLRFFIEYHDGYSLEGQFCKDPTNYFAIRSSYGF